MKNIKSKFDYGVNVTKKAGRIIRNGLLFNPVENYFAFTRILCISLEENGAYIVYGRKVFSHLKIKHCWRIVPEAGGLLTPDILASQVAAVVSGQKATRSEYVLCIPKSWTIFRIAEFPVTVKENLANVVYYELDRMTPLTNDNAYYDHEIIAENSGKINIFLAATKAERINPYLKALAAKNMKIGKLTVSSLAIHHLIKMIYKNGDALYICFNENAYECGLIMNNSVVRSFSGVVEGVINSAVDDILKQIEPSAELLSAGGRQAKAAIICSDETDYQLIREKLPKLKVSHLNKDIKLSMPQQKQDLSLVAAGAFLETITSEGDTFNLLKKRNGTKKQSPFRLTMISVILIILIGIFSFLAPMFIEKNKIEIIDGYIETLKPEAKKVEALKKDAEKIAAEMDIIYDFKMENILTVELIKELTNILPKKTWLTRLRIANNAVEIEGYATSATEIVPLLENSRYFQKVEFASPTFRDPRKGTERFVIKMELRNSNILNKHRDANKKNEKKK